MTCPDSDHSGGGGEATLIPISDDNPVRLTPFVTWFLIAACVAAFGWQWSLGPERATAIFRFGFIPSDFFGHLGSGGDFSAQAVDMGSIVTSMFLHGGLLHLAGNMLYLWIFGNNIEDAMGHSRFLLFYLLCGVVAAISMALIDPHSAIPMIGASGAISGVLAAYLLLYPRARVKVIIPIGVIFYGFTISALWVVGLWFVTQVAYAMLSDPSQPGVAWWAHVGGFLAGLFLTPVFKAADVPYFGSGWRGPWS